MKMTERLNELDLLEREKLTGSDLVTELRMLWAFSFESGGARWVTLAIGSTEKSLEEMQYIAESKMQGPDWGNNCFAFQILKNGKVYCEYEI